ncbi:MAG: winged helix-turn-helix transcriptional regulator [Candidatus Bathyarchaeia archaeon]|nr:winged helix-turn-helix transcriptional regulator [Candidatus Bathyarchaeota archaeon]
MSVLEKKIVELLSKSEPLTLMEIAERLNKSPKAVFRALRKLFEKGRVGCDIKTRRYYLETDYEEHEEDIEDINV